MAWPRRPAGQLKGSLDSAPFCESLASRGVLVAPGACFGAPAHFRIGLAASADFDSGAEVVAKYASAATPARRHEATAITTLRSA